MLAKRITSSAGFTVIEVLVASVIGMFVAVVAVGMLQAVAVSSERAQVYAESAAQITYAADMIRQDLRNIHLRMPEEQAAVTWYPGQDGQSSSLRFYTVSHTKAREQLPEGDVYEVEYSLGSDDEQQDVLTRRYWPNPDEYNEPAGVLTVIARDVVTFDVQFFDGQQWQSQWDPLSEEVPEMVTVMLASQVGPDQPTLEESFVVVLPDFAEDADEQDQQGQNADQQQEQGQGQQQEQGQGQQQGQNQQQGQGR